MYWTYAECRCYREIRKLIISSYFSDKFASNLPISEQYGQTGERWARLQKAADLLTEGKTATLAERMNQQGDIPVSHAERKVKGSSEWREYIDTMVGAKYEANLAKIDLAVLKMRLME